MNVPKNRILKDSLKKNLVCVLGESPFIVTQVRLLIFKKTMTEIIRKFD